MSVDNDAVVRFQDVGKTFVSRGHGGALQTVQALRDVTFGVRDREFLSILGPSGCGKTTCLRILAGLTGVDAGRVAVMGKPVTGPGRERAVVPERVEGEHAPAPDVLQACRPVGGDEGGGRERQQRLGKGDRRRGQGRSLRRGRFFIPMG